MKKKHEKESERGHLHIIRRTRNLAMRDDDIHNIVFFLFIFHPSFLRFFNYLLRSMAMAYGVYRFAKSLGL